MLMMRAIASSSTSDPSSASVGAASRRRPLPWRSVRCRSSVLSRRSRSRTASMMLVVGFRSSSIAQLPICSDVSTSSTSSGCRSASPVAMLTARVDFPTPPLLLRNAATRPCAAAAAAVWRANSRSITPRSSVADNGRRRKSRTCARSSSMSVVALRAALVEAIGHERAPRWRLRARAPADLSTSTAISAGVAVDVDDDQVRLAARARLRWPRDRCRRTEPYPCDRESAPARSGTPPRARRRRRRPAPAELLSPSRGSSHILLITGPAPGRAPDRSSPVRSRRDSSAAVPSSRRAARSATPPTRSPSRSTPRLWRHRA